MGLRRSVVSVICLLLGTCVAAIIDLPLEKHVRQTSYTHKSLKHEKFLGHQWEGWKTGVAVHPTGHTVDNLQQTLLNIPVSVSHFPVWEAPANYIKIDLAILGLYDSY